MSEKLTWEGIIYSVQPRIRLFRSFDERTHSYLGYVLHLKGTIGGDEGEFAIAIGKAAHAKHQFRVGDHVQGGSVPVRDERLETAGYYKTSGLKIVAKGEDVEHQPPPWMGVAPELEVYRARGHRRLHPPTYNTACVGCIWGCKMPVEILIDPWGSGSVRYRFETFCYGPKSCPLYRAGAKRKVPGRRGMAYVEEDWVDEDATAHRAWDE